VLGSGKLLVATPTIVDPNFSRTVVLLCQYGSDGAVGLVLNRISTIPVEAYLPGWARLTPPPGMVGIGGPVETEAAIGLAIGTVMADLWTPVTEGLGLVDLHMQPEDFPGLESVRVFAGYSGWGPGQLDQEVTEAGWFIVDREPGDVQAPDLDWSAVLKRQRSDIALFADYPPDPTMN
jgi:putative transcriptional regulator